jgi:hypothetical protein
MFRAFFKPIFKRQVYKVDSGYSLLGMVLASGPGLARPGPDANTIPSRIEPLSTYTVPLEDGLKESLKHGRQK